ncbi:LytTR family two component transcriptional regulator [Nonlabens xylanidelens]|uniref:LytTR family two component transcriptional regulator n=1 Tax=Nonlabens xylanidelens TaxID=191564 RepID=A0A2S6IKN3_9FLAO|nr:LytTR family DNA-binding domain-containing protein [Nonlabens xylanidelens]PPK94794.1 LytTR family two component transcriptional regulator [Nonlabens xylanidelens]PQJ17354.1 DNA-binding response regulator [Nonlabens xylanidelens]
MKTYSAIIVDDEFSALQNLHNKILKMSSQVTVIDTFQDSKLAVKSIIKNTPDLLFLDIQMPGMTGFELLQQLPTLSSQVIFSTAYNEYALEALKQNAVDYVLKPVDNQELKEAINKAIFNIEKLNADQNANLVQLLNKIIDRDHKLKVPTQKGISFIPQEEVIHLEGYEGYTKIHLVDGKVLTSSYSLGKFSSYLDDYFFKCHKSHIVNIKAVRAFENEGYVVLGDEYRVPITKTYKQAFLELFN